MAKTTTAQILDVAMQVMRLDTKGRAHIYNQLGKEFGAQWAGAGSLVKRELKKKATKEEGQAT